VPAYYNEIDPFAVAWLRELIKAGHIADGIVDDRSIEDVRPDDLVGFTQCHFFAGIGVWSYALRQAGWPDNRPVWTGSPPCQPFSNAGKRQGFKDERHLLPHFIDLIKERRPPVVFGEQVEAAIRTTWLDTLQVDLEAENYAVGAIVLPACGVGAPHIRQRAWIVGERLDNAERKGLEGFAGNGDASYQPGRLDAQPHGPVTEAGGTGRMADAENTDRRPGKRPTETGTGQEEIGGIGSPGGGINGRTRQAHGFWGDPDWLYCRDGKWRPVEPGTFPLAHGAPARVGRLRGYGNAINAEAAKEIINSYMEYADGKG